MLFSELLSLSVLSPVTADDTSYSNASQLSIKTGAADFTQYMISCAACLNFFRKATEVIVEKLTLHCVKPTRGVWLRLIEYLRKCSLPTVDS